MQDTILYLTSIWNMIAENMHWKNDPMNKRILWWAANWEEIGRIFYVCMYILYYIIESLFLSFVQKCTKVSVVVYKNISILSANGS